jgi:iron complex outermembrane receptor protein
VNSPEHVAQLQVDAPLYDEGPRLALELRAMDKRRTLTGETPGFALLDLALTTPGFLPGLSAAFAVENVFDHDYAYPVGPELVQDALAQDGRTFFVRLTWHP